jgi:outer membrane receptor protein involved in Fe transport
MPGGGVLPASTWGRQRVVRVLRLCLLVVLTSGVGTQVRGAEIGGTTTDPSGGPLEAARVTLLNLASGAELVTESDAAGRFVFDGLSVGIYRVAVERDGYSGDSRTVSIAAADERLDTGFVLRPGGLTTSVTVTATRSARDALDVPLATETLTRPQLLRATPVSTGDAMVLAPSITPVGSGPYGVRPRLRGLDSTRLLVLVDGERLNNARTATDRSGTEVGLIDLATVESIEFVSGAGSVLYGTDALAGTINILTNQPAFSDTVRFEYGFDGLYSSNESGRRGTVTLGVRTPRVAAQIIGGVEAFDDYEAGGDAAEDTRPLYADGTLRQGDTIDDLGFAFDAFPDPFNAPFVRSDNRIPTSSAEGNTLNASALVALSDRHSLRVKYLRRRMTDVGFPDFAPPFFFQRITLPRSDLDRLSARYEARGLAPWFTNLKISAYFQEQTRLLRNEFPVQFPVPSQAFFPISVFRLDILSDTEQNVRTPGVDVQGTFLVSDRHVITAGTTMYVDRSQDSRRTVTQTSQVGTVGFGPRGLQAIVFPAAVPLGPPVVTHPVRVPDSRFRDLGVFVQDEWVLGANLKAVLGLRYDSYRVTTEPTPGYDVASLAQGAQPPIDPGTLPDINGDRLGRHAVTGDAGLLVRVTNQVSLLAHYGRSYRHPNLEELLFSGEATVGAILPNLRVEPETGHNVDVGLRVQAPQYAASLSYFHNRFDGFISTEIVADTPSDPVSQAINFADVRLQGLEAEGEVPLALGPGLVTLFGHLAYTRGDVVKGTNRFTGTSLDGTPQDNITPLKTVLGVRLSDARNRMWVEYGNRYQAEVERVAVTLSESPFLIAQDLLSLQAFTVHRLAFGLNLARERGRLGLTVAIENLSDRFYREHFQFAPARGRSLVAALTVRGH